MGDDASEEAKINAELLHNNKYCVLGTDMLAADSFQEVLAYPTGQHTEDDVDLPAAMLALRVVIATNRYAGYSGRGVWFG